MSALRAKATQTAIVVTAEGEIEVPHEAVRAQLKRHAGDFDLTHGPSELLVLRRCAGDQGVFSSRVVLSGQILDSSTMRGVAAMLAHAGWTGQLHVYGPQSHHCLSLSGGTLRAASTDGLDAQLGDFLVERGALSYDQLARCLADATASNPLGQVALGRGYITRPKLFGYLIEQAERIFHNAVATTMGSYLFAQVPGQPVTPPVRLNLSVADLLKSQPAPTDRSGLYAATRVTALVDRIERANDALLELLSYAARYGNDERVRRELWDWIETHGLMPCFRARHPELTADPDAVARQVADLSDSRAHGWVTDVLHELLSYAAFLTSPGLPPPVRAELDACLDHHFDLLRA